MRHPTVNIESNSSLECATRQGKGSNMTRKYALVALACYLLPFSVFRGDESKMAGGSILLFEADPGSVIVVADSRLTQGSKPVSDLECKIISLSDDTLFFYSGAMAQVDFSRTQKRVTANEIGRNAFRKAGAQRNSLRRLFDLANQWAKNMKPVADSVLQFSRPEDRPKETQLGGFAGLDSEGFPRLVVANMSVNVDNATRRATASYDVYQWPRHLDSPIGEGGALEDAPIGTGEFLEGTTDRAKIAIAQLQKRLANKSFLDFEAYRLIAAVEFAMRWNPHETRVGGKVDAVVLNNGQKVRWIQRKQVCYKEDYPPTTRF
ncbi:MAG TPA: hypothetical protein VIH76_02080 [Candidatus Acidoferrales bacterium]